MGQIKDFDDFEYAVNIENAAVYLNQKEILHSINWKVKKGERYFILGANGAGKTTLVRMMLGYIWPLYGAKVEILGKRLGKFDLVYAFACVVLCAQVQVERVCAFGRPFWHQPLFLCSDRKVSPGSVPFAPVFHGISPCWHWRHL